VTAHAGMSAARKEGLKERTKGGMKEKLSVILNSVEKFGPGPFLEQAHKFSYLVEQLIFKFRNNYFQNWSKQALSFINFLSRVSLGLVDFLQQLSKILCCGSGSGRIRHI
jgi:hypothetical protein